MKRLKLAIAVGAVCVGLAGVQHASAAVLFWDDFSVGTSAVPGAIALAGLTGVGAVNQADFNTKLAAGGWDAVIFGEQSSGVFPSSAAGLASWVTGRETDRHDVAHWRTGLPSRRQLRFDQWNDDHDGCGSDLCWPRGDDFALQPGMGNLLAGLECRRRCKLSGKPQLRRVCGDHGQRGEHLPQWPVERHLPSPRGWRAADC